MNAVSQRKYLFESSKAGRPVFERHLIDIRHKVDVLNARHFDKYGVIVGNETHVRFSGHRVFDDIFSANGNFALFERLHSFQAAERGRLARAVVPEQAYNLSGADSEDCLRSRSEHSGRAGDTGAGAW